MKTPRQEAPPVAFDPFEASVGLGFVTGLFSLVAPSLVPLAGTLAALAAAGLASRRARGPGHYDRSRGILRIATMGVACALAGFALYSSGLAPAGRGLLFGTAWVPFWLVERARGPLGVRRNVLP